MGANRSIVTSVTQPQEKTVKRVVTERRARTTDGDPQGYRKKGPIQGTGTPVTDPGRPKDFLTQDEVQDVLNACKGRRHASRDALVCLLMFRHGLRVTEAVRMRITDVDLKNSRLWVNRLKGGLSVEHPIEGDELRAIRRYLAERKDSLPWLFVSERQAPLTRQAVNHLLWEIGKTLGVRLHPHMLRHSCGFYLANRGYDLRLIQDYLGHRDPKHTTHYTRTAAIRFEGLWGRR